VVEAGGETGLPQEALPRPVVVHDTRGEDLQRNGPTQADIQRPVHLAHAASPDQLLGEIARHWRSFERMSVVHRGS
jgi:hypothetical protein